MFYIRRKYFDGNLLGKYCVYIQFFLKKNKYISWWT